MNLLLYGSLAILLLTHNGKTKFLGRFKEIENELSTVLNFCDTKYKQIHFDGLLGISLTHTFLAKALSIPSSRSTKQEILALTNKCKAIRKKIYPLLPNEPKYMINYKRDLQTSVRNKLLNIERWMDIVRTNFSLVK
ncbi:hypothetical protein NQ317_008645 [Molorchus minor]|uniref:Uncharacterized protein n=1 Tax=Molorchus minor TaxID=1323400 RepID=A0ABQ9K027_9CUCU|nr:hypothetical protein NQ317_008645 [Molorchus minor]